jgi:hypothetical protein
MAVLAVDLEIPGMGIVGKGDGLNRRGGLGRGRYFPLLGLHEGQG